MYKQCPSVLMREQYQQAIQDLLSGHLSSTAEGQRTAGPHLGSVSSTVFSSSHTSLTSPFLTLL